MSTQDKLERVLRDIHVLISRSELYDSSGERIIVEKKRMFEHLNNLNACIYEMMDEYEMTQQSRDRAERETKKRGDDMIFRASRNAEDVYAAAVLYTDEALVHVQNIMKDTAEAMSDILKKAQADMEDRRRVIRENQSELKGQLQDMVDTEKYLKLIEERNRQIEQERLKEQEAPDKKQERGVSASDSGIASVKPEIRINQEYFKRMGIDPKEEAQEEEKPEKPDIMVNLDAEYFKWKKGNDKKSGRKSREEL